jgi:hypothetical protein
MLRCDRGSMRRQRNYLTVEVASFVDEAFSVGTIEAAVTAPDGEVAGGTAMGWMITVRVEVEV